MSTTLDQLLAARRSDDDPNRPFLTVGGVDYPLPKTPPMGFTLLMRKHQRESGPDKKLGPEDIDQLLRLAVGSELVDALYREAIEAEDLEPVLKYVTDVWAGSRSLEGGDGSAGEAVAPSGGTQSTSTRIDTSTS